MITPSDGSEVAPIQGCIEIHFSSVLLKIHTGFEELSSIYKNKSVDISFCINRMPFQLQHQALQWLRDHKLFEILFKNARSLPRPHNIHNHPRYKHDGILNTEQAHAVENIVKAENRPLPYLLFGPPGNVAF